MSPVIEDRISAYRVFWKRERRSYPAMRDDLFLIAQEVEHKERRRIWGTGNLNQGGTTEANFTLLVLVDGRRFFIGFSYPFQRRMCLTVSRPMLTRSINTILEEERCLLG
jgi:hypothetical protein